MKTAVSSQAPSATGGALLVIAAATLWGTTGTAQALAPAGATPLTVGSMRLIVGALGLLLIARRQRQLPTPAELRRWPLGALFTAAISMAAYQLLFFAGVARAGVAIGTLVGIGSTPILAGLLGWLVRRERPSRRWYAATALAIAGCGLLVGTAGTIEIDLPGIALAVGAGGAYALYTLMTKQLLETHAAASATAVTFAIGALLLLPFVLLGDMAWLREPAGLLVALHLGLVTVALGYLLFARGLTAVPVATAATLTLAEPLTAAALGVIVLGETLTAPALAGVALLFTGLLILSMRRGGDERPHS